MRMRLSHRVPVEESAGHTALVQDGEVLDLFDAVGDQYELDRFFSWMLFGESDHGVSVHVGLGAVKFGLNMLWIDLTSLIALNFLQVIQKLGTSSCRSSCCTISSSSSSLSDRRWHGFGVSMVAGILLESNNSLVAVKQTTKIK